MCVALTSMLRCLTWVMHPCQVFELGDTDINPIGCISGKCAIIKARTYEEVSHAPAQMAPPRVLTVPVSRCGLLDEGAARVP